MKHITVLKDEAIEYLNIKPDGIYVDLTLGGAGHSEEILKNLTTGHLYAFDQDEYALGVASKKLSKYNNKTLIFSNFSKVKEKLNELGITKVDGILADLGMSSFQIDDESRGFTYLKDTELDMRMNQSASLTAKEIVNTYSLEDLANIFYRYGDELNSFKIAREIIKRRPLETTFDLVAICDFVNRGRKGHSSKKVFQALRIAVNKEMEVLEQMLLSGLDILNDEGRFVIITFHSLEDRIVKHFFKEHSTLNLPKNLPLIDLPKTPLKLVTRKPILPSEEELEVNSRSRSAKMRVAEKNKN